jgi:alginate O-acetyltransferase complex protein AlgI
VSFFDPGFLFAFLPVALLGFYAAGRWLGRSAALAVLTIESIVFCLPFGWRFTVLMLGSALGNWWFCRAAAAPGAPSPARKWAFRGGIAFNLLLLCVFKYWNVFSWLPPAARLTPLIALWVPITISFYTFQRLVLLADAHRRDPAALALLFDEGKAHRPSFRLAAFLTAFPNLVIGPIVYASEVAPQLMSPRFGRVRRSNIEVGLTLFVIGLFKKIILADALGLQIVDDIFGKVAAGTPVLALEVLFAMLAYYAQLYFDFSGYSDMALGVARLFGLRFPYNFNSPLRATGIVDFYKRWHITLTRIVARFLFQPLSIAGTRWTARRRIRGWRAKPLSLWLPIMANFLIIGLWHGASWTFALFGTIHGLWFILETEVRATKAWKNWTRRTSSRLRLLLGQALTVAPLATTFSLFRSASVADFFALFGYLGQDWGAFFRAGASHIILSREYALLFVAFALIWLTPNPLELLARYRPGIATFVVPSHTPRLLAFRWRPTLVWGIFVAVLLSWVIAAMSAPAPFAYGGF